MHSISRQSLRSIAGLLAGAALLGGAARAQAGDDEDRLIGNLLSGLVGSQQPAGAATYTAQERDRLVSLLVGGEYATSRQGEPVDAVVFGVPLTRVEHVYTARPVNPTPPMAPATQAR